MSALPLYDSDAQARRLELADQRAGETTLGRFELGRFPRVVDGILVMSRTVVAESAASSVDYPVFFIPAGSVGTVGVTARAVGVGSTAGRWTAVWVGSDEAERDRALAALLDDLGAWSAR